jgi:hypothetical protein
MGRVNEQQVHLTIAWVDGGKADDRICLVHRDEEHVRRRVLDDELFPFLPGGNIGLRASSPRYVHPSRTAASNTAPMLWASLATAVRIEIMCPAPRRNCRLDHPPAAERPDVDAERSTPGVSVSRRCHLRLTARLNGSSHIRSAHRHSAARQASSRTASTAARQCPCAVYPDRDRLARIGVRMPNAAGSPRQAIA